MFRQKYFYPLIFLISACGEQTTMNYPALKQFGDIHAPEEKTASLPPSFTQCDERFSWSTGKFDPKAYKFMFDKPEYNLRRQMAVGTHDTTDLPSKSGSGARLTTRLSERQKQLCSDIFNKINGSGPVFRDSKLHQYFDYDDVINLTNSDSNFQEIKEKIAVLINSFFTYDPATKIRTYVDNVMLPVSVECENKWMVKPDPSVSEIAIFKQPEVKCFFTLDNHEIELISGKKIPIALNGFYEIDSEYPDKIMEIHIERYGFKELNP